MTMLMVVIIIMAINDICLARHNPKARKIKSGRCLKIFAAVLFWCDGDNDVDDCESV